MLPPRIAVSRFLTALRPVDALIIAFTLFLTVIVIFFAVRISSSWSLIAINVASVTGIAVLSRGALGSDRWVIRAVHDWYVVPSIFLLFKEVYIIIQSLHRGDWDPLFILVDRSIFGTDPTVWLSRFASPILTEVLQIAYVSYYFIMLTVAVEVYRRQDKEKFSFVLFTILYGFFLSYLGYLVFPAVGPRFTLHDFNSLNAELPGLWLTNGLREFLDAGESIPANAVNAIAFAQRDAFPSGHTQMTLISLFFAYRYALKSRHLLLTFGSLLIISTVYLRYHYVIDLVGGGMFMWFTISTAPKLFQWWETRR